MLQGAIGERRVAREHGDASVTVIARDSEAAAPRLLVAGEDGIFKMPDLKNMTMKAIADSMPPELVRLEFEGSGVAFRQSPAPGATIKEGQRVRVAFRRMKIN